MHVSCSIVRQQSFYMGLWPFKEPAFSTAGDGRNNSLKNLAIMGLAFAMVIDTEDEVSHLH